MLPTDETTINVVPSSRLRPATWTVGTSTFQDLFPTTIDLARVPGGSAAPTSVWLLVALGLFALGSSLAGDAWGRAAVARAGGRLTSLRAQLDANVGWWLMALALATAAAQIAIYIRR